MADKDLDLVIRSREQFRAAFGELEKALQSVEKQTTATSAETASLSDKVRGFAESHRGYFQAAGVAIGALATGIAAAATAVVKLGIHGAMIDDVRVEFDRLARSSGVAGEVLERDLAKAVDGTVRRFDLMKAANQAMSQGLRLSADDWKVVGEGARILADRIGGDTKTAFETLTQAMATGRDKTLATIGVNVDAAQAMDDYARSIGTTASKLTESEQTYAKQQAMLEALRAELVATGGVQVDFADYFAIAKTRVMDFTDELGQGIATSPVFLAGMEGIGESLQSAFGTENRSFIQRVVGWIEKAAIVTLDFAQIGLTAAGVIGRAFQGLLSIIHGVAAVLILPVVAITAIIAKVAELATKLPGVGDQFKGLALSARLASNFVTDLQKDFTNLSNRELEGVKGHSAFQTSLDAIGETLQHVQDRMVAAAAATRQTGAAAKEARGPIAALHPPLDGVAVRARAAADAFEKFKATMKDPDLKLGVGGLLNHLRDFQEDTPVLISQIPQIGIAFEKLGKQVGKDAAPAINQVTVAIQKALTAFPQLIQQAFTGGGGLTGGIKAVFSGLGGDLMGSLFKGGVGKAIGGGISKLFGDTIGGALNTMLPGIGSAIGSLLGPVIGKVGGFFKGLFGGESKENKELKALAGDFLKLHGGIDQVRSVAKLLGDDIEVALGGKGKSGLEALTRETADFDQRLQKVKDGMPALTDLLGQAAQFGGALPERFAPALEQLRQLGLLQEGQGFRWQNLKDAASRYGVELEALGPKFQGARLHDGAKQILDDFELLTAGGGNVGQVLQGMSDEISALVIDSLKFGQAIPENMRPLVESLIASGQLIDANGQKMTDTSKIKFGDPIKVGLDAVVQRLDDLLVGLGIRLPTVMATGVSSAIAEAGRLAGGIASAIAAIPKDFSFKIHGEGTGDVQHAQHGLAGFFGRHGGLVRMHGLEAAIPLDRPATGVPDWVFDRIAAMHGGGAAGPPVVQVVKLVVDGRELAEAVIPKIPHVLSRWGLRD